MKKTFALLLAAIMMLALLTACGGGDKPAESTPPADTSAPADTGSDAAEPEAPAAGGNIGVCIYKFDDAFMTTYRNAQKILSKLGFHYIGDEFYEPTGLYHPSYELTSSSQ